MTAGKRAQRGEIRSRTWVITDEHNMKQRATAAVQRRYLDVKEAALAVRLTEAQLYRARLSSKLGLEVLVTTMEAALVQ